MIKHNEHKNNFKSKIDIVVDLIYHDNMIKMFEIVFFINRCIDVEYTSVGLWSSYHNVWTLLMRAMASVHDIGPRFCVLLRNSRLSSNGCRGITGRKLALWDVS